MPKQKFASFSQQDYEVLERKILYQGIFRMVGYKVRYRLYEGGFSQPVFREVMERNSSAGILLYDPILDKVVLIEQFRAGVINKTKHPWLIEVVAGSFNDGEKAPNVAMREAIEEAGCEILELYPICQYYVSPGGCSEYLHLFCGRINSENTGGIFGLKEEDEDILALSLSSDEAFNMLKEGKIKTSPAIIALQWLQLNRNWLKQLWQKK